MRTMVRVIGVVLMLAMTGAGVGSAAEDSAEAQWEALNGQVVQAYQEGKYQDGIALAEQALALAREAFGPEHPDTLTSMNNLALLYQSQGRYGDAEPLYAETLAVRRRVLGPEHPSTLTSMNNLAALYDDQGRYGDAEPLYAETLVVRSRVLGPEHPDTLASMNNLAFLYKAQGRYGDAEPLYAETLAVRRRVLGPEHPDTLTSMNNLALLYQSQGRYGDAEPLYAETLAAFRSVLGPEHPDTLTSMNNLAFLYESQGRYREAEPLCAETLAISRRVLGPEHPDTLTSMNNLATLYGSQGRYGDAEPLYAETLAVRRRVLGPEHPDTLISMISLAFLYESQGRYGDAEPLYTETLAAFRSVLGPEHPSTLTSMNNLASLYHSQGRYGDAEPLYVETLAVRRRVLGPEHPSTLTSMNNLASLYHSQGRYGDAEPLYAETLAVHRRVLGPEHPSTLTSMNNLALLYQSQGRYGDAEPLYAETLAVRRRVLGPEHPDTLTSMNNLALLYQSQGRYGDAEPLYAETLSVHRRVLGPKHPSTLTSMNNLALLYSHLGRYEDAKPLFAETLSVSRRVLGPEHPDTMLYATNMIVSFSTQGKYDQAVDLLRQMEPNVLAWLHQELYATEAVGTKRLAVNSQRSFQSFALSLALAVPDNAEARRVAASAVLRFKSLQEEEEGWLARIGRRGRDPRILEKVEAIEGLRTRLSHAAAQGDPAPLIRDLEQTELALGKISRDYEQHLQVRKANLRDLQGLLGQTQALVDLWKFQPVDFGERILAAPHYAAIIHLGARDPQVVDLGPASEIDALALDPNAGRQLYDRVIAPLLPFLDGATSVAIAPDGQLSLVNLPTLPDAEGRPWGATMPVSVIQTGRDLLWPQTDRPARGLLALGDIDYGAAPATLQSASAGDVTQPIVYDPLPATSKEVADIHFRYRNARKVENSPAPWTGTEASEAALRTLETPPRVLHLATHGVFQSGAPTTGGESRPMLRAWVALAGANAAGAANDNAADGLLYAIEAQGLNLEGTELVVLSACETGQGVVEDGEGVYGLVRAFRTAGAANVLMALRPVNDSDAADFMTRFYHHWLQDNVSLAEAFRQTQRDYIDGKASGDWTAFVLIGTGRPWRS